MSQVERSARVPIAPFAMCCSSSGGDGVVLAARAVCFHADPSFDAAKKQRYRDE